VVALEGGAVIAKPGRMIPVVLGEPIDGAPPNFVECPPVIFVHIAADASWTRSSQVPPSHNDETYTAMLDTGANRTAIRPGVAAAIGALTNGDGVAHGIGGTQAGIKRTSIQILSLKGDVIFVCRDAAVMQLPGDARSFDAILGRQFLKFCRLLVDGPNGAYRLEWVGEPVQSK
jgi:hypothetical protein